MNNLWKRIFTAFVLGLIVIASVSAGSYNLIFLVFIINALGLNEFYALTLKPFPARMSGLAFSFILFVSCVLVIIRLVQWQFLLVNIPAAFSLFLISLYSSSENPFAEMALDFLGIICITVPCIFLVLLSYVMPLPMEYHPRFILGIFIITWASDTGAYFTGKLIGKHALFRSVSPHKTWEGSFGGVFLAMGAAVVSAEYCTQTGFLNWLSIAAIIIVAGTYGDLIKSRLKRSAHVKDSGNLLPGHGGILDRFDSLLGAAPFIFIYVILLQYV